MEQPVRRPRRRKKKTPNSKQVLIAGCVIGAVALIVAACIFLFGGNAGDQENKDNRRSSMPELTISAIERNGENMEVRTSYMSVAYPYAFSDLITVKAINLDDMTGLEFSAKLDGADRKLYTIWFNGDHGSHLGTYDPGDAEGTAPVTVAFYNADPKLGDDDRKTFAATQETFNDVLDFMRKDPRFTEAA